MNQKEKKSKIAHLESVLADLNLSLEKKKNRFVEFRQRIYDKMRDKKLSLLNIGERQNRINFMKISRKDDVILQKQIIKSIFSTQKRIALFSEELMRLKHEKHEEENQDKKKQPDGDQNSASNMVE